jgi:hypothetical protein
MHESGRRYAWVRARTVPQITCERAQDLWAFIQRRLHQPSAKPERPTRDDDLKLPAWTDAEEKRVRSALTAIPADDRQIWLNVGMALHWTEWPSAREIWDRWSRSSPKFDEADQEKNWISFDRGYDGPLIKLGTLFMLAQQHGWMDDSSSPRPRHANGEDVGEDAGATGEDPDESADPADLFSSPAREPQLTPDMLPGVIAAFAVDTAERLGVELAMIAVPALVSYAVALDDRIKIQPKVHDTGWQERPCLWVAIVADPGGRKSPAIEKATRPLVDRENQWVREDVAKLAQYAVELAIFKKNQRRGKADVKTPPNESVEAPAKPPDKPLQRRLTANDVTMEKLAFILHDNPRGIFWIHDELMGLVASFDAYRQNKAGKDRAAALQLWNGGQRLVDRVKIDGSVRVPNWSASVLGGIQPDKLRDLARNLSEDGFLQRFLVFAGRTIGMEEDREPNREAISDYFVTASRLLDIPPPGKPIRLSPEAQEHRVKVEEVAEDMIGLPEHPPALRGHLAKWGALHGRLLLTLHAIECMSSGGDLKPEVSGETAKKARDLMLKFFLPNAVNFYLEFFPASPVMDDARWIAGHILAHKHERITLRDIRRAYPKLAGDEGAILGAMKTLARMRWVGDPARQKNGGTTWTINPRVHIRFTERAREETKRREDERRKIAERRARLRAVL